MELTGTAKRILDVSLDLFSRYGYASVSMEQIADAVGIKAPSLYKHFKGKQAIFDSILTLMDERYQKQAAGMRMHLQDGGTDTELFLSISEEDLLRKVEELVAFALHDEYDRKFRRLMASHQFSDDRIRRLFTERQVDLLIRYHTELFRRMIGAGVFVDGDAEMMALEYVSPVYTLIGICDREPEREAECLSLLRRHIRQFNDVYRTDRRNQ